MTERERERERESSFKDHQYIILDYSNLLKVRFNMKEV